MTQSQLPIEEALPALRVALKQRNVAVLEAPPGAGKTTRVPLALFDESWLAGKRVIMLEPRRLAARNAAMYMARSLGERAGETVGYRVRGDSRVGANTRIEIVTEGVLTRLRASDPSLDAYGLVIFDEFHERSLHADLGLALVLQTQELLRPELRVLVMSATLDGIAVAQCLATDGVAAPVVRSAGRMYPVDTQYRAPRPDERLELSVSRVAREALDAHAGDVLVFLPGAAEQRRCAGALTNVLSQRNDNVQLHVLHGTQSFAEQEAAIAPAPNGYRKIVLATSVAETSLTIEGVRTVVDSGWSRLPRYSPRTGLVRLETVRVSRASADQRRGRAGRLGPGQCYRLWDVHEDAMLSPRTRPELLDADLSYLILELADAGVTDVDELRWMDLPPSGAVAQARELLQQLGALTAELRITPHGQQMAKLPVAPRLAHMMIAAGDKSRLRLATLLAASLEERDFLSGARGEVPADVRLRMELLAKIANDGGGNSWSDSTHTVSRDALARVNERAHELMQRAGEPRGTVTIAALDIAETGSLLALAYPDRIAQRRSGSGARFLLRNGMGASLPAHDALASEAYIAVAEIDGLPPEYRVARAAPISLKDVREQFSEQIVRVDSVDWDEAARAVRGWRREMLGAIVLEEHRINKLDPIDVAAVILGVLRRIGLAQWPMSPAAQQLQQRLAFLHQHDNSWPDVSPDSLTSTISTWFEDEALAIRTWSDIERADWTGALLTLVPWNRRALLDVLAPTHVQVPSGSRIAVDYSDPVAPSLSVKLQEVFGWTESPRVLDGRVALTLELLSPAQRPVQVTRDLAGFWRSSYFDVRKELRGRYPRHPWPEDPLTAIATRRAKPRGT